LSARLCGRNDFALRSGSGFLCGRHVVSSFGYILQHMYICLEDYAPTDCDQRSSRERSAKEEWWIHCMKRKERFNQNELQRT
jgi:hypothetical protein